MPEPELPLGADISGLWLCAGPAVLEVTEHAQPEPRDAAEQLDVDVDGDDTDDNDDADKDDDDEDDDDDLDEAEGSLFGDQEPSYFAFALLGDSLPRLWCLPDRSSVCWAELDASTPLFTRRGGDLEVNLVTDLELDLDGDPDRDLDLECDCDADLALSLISTSILAPSGFCSRLIARSPLGLGTPRYSALFISSQSVRFPSSKSSLSSYLLQ